MRIMMLGSALIGAFANPQAAPQASPTPQTAPMTPAPAPTDPATPITEGCVIPMGTPVLIEVMDSVKSETAKIGGNFAIRLADPLIVNGMTLVPAGTAGQGEVIHAAKKRFSDSGELILAARYLAMGEVKVPLRSFRINRSAGVGLSVTYVVPGAFVALPQTYNVEVPAHTIAQAKVAADTSVACPAADAGAGQ
jgi:hypothetical protein